MKRFMFVAAGLLFGAILAVPAWTQGEKSAEITGTVVDAYCLITMDMGGKAHKKCATMCVKNGAPVAIKEDKTGTLYFTAGQKNMMYASAGLEKYLEERVTVKGKVFEKEGVRMVVVESVSPVQ